MNVALESLVAAGLNEARRVAERWAKSSAAAGGWTLAGELERGEPDGGRICVLRTARENPLRLESPRREWAVVCPFLEWRSDGGSIPRALQMHNDYIDLRAWAFPRAYGLHDAFYGAGRVPVFDLVCGGWGWADMPRRAADAAAAVALALEGATRATVAAVHGALAVFGGVAWDAHRRAGPPPHAVWFEI